MKISKLGNVGLSCTWRPHVRPRRSFRIFLSVAILAFFCIIPQVFGVDAGTQTSLQPDKGGHIELKKPLIINFLAKADPPPTPISENPPKTTQRTTPKTMDFFMDGVDALDMENFEEAARLFKKAVALEPGNLEYQYYLAVAYVRIKKKP